MSTVHNAAEVFVRGHSFTRSIRNPYTLERHGDLWVMRDPPGSKRPRKTEVVAVDAPVEATLDQISGMRIGWHFICHIHEREDEFDSVRARYKSAGYRAIATEWMFSHRLIRVPSFESDPPATIVRTLESARRVSKAAGRIQIREDAVSAEDAQHRLYAVYVDGTAVGWVSSIAVGAAGWVSNLYVAPEHRGRGFGRGLMCELLRGDARRGLTSSVLLASSAGARLYPHVGYERIAVLQMFCPNRRNPETN